MNEQPPAHTPARHRSVRSNGDEISDAIHRRVSGDPNSVKPGDEVVFVYRESTRPCAAIVRFAHGRTVDLFVAYGRETVDVRINVPHESEAGYHWCFWRWP